MEHLIQERSEVRFHQPSLIEAAKQVLVLQRRNHLEVASIPPIPPKSTADEVGIQLAGLLKNSTRREQQGGLCVADPQGRIDGTTSGHERPRRLDSSNHGLLQTALR